MILIDGIGMIGGLAESVESIRSQTHLMALSLIDKNELEQVQTEFHSHLEYPTIHSTTGFGMGPFQIPLGSNPIHSAISYSLQAPTTSSNIFRILRSMQLGKPILLEGSPGVGKTSLITAMAQKSGHNLVRINLSEQTDLMDLLGTDLPIEGKAGEFAWTDGILLSALKNGDWVLLDEMNLASQSILEGLNSILDHRSQIYIPELDRTFDCPKQFRVFAAQNPVLQGGGRKGLPKSFLNRFMKVFLEPFSESDLLFIASEMFPNVSSVFREQLIKFNTRLHTDIVQKSEYGFKGSPWEFNLRDIFRTCQMAETNPTMSYAQLVNIVYVQRMRTVEDRQMVATTFGKFFPQELATLEKLINTNPRFFLTQSSLQVGSSFLPRMKPNQYLQPTNDICPQLLHHFLQPLEAVMKSCEMDWMVVLSGNAASGKTSLLRLLAQLTGRQLYEFSMNTAIDTTEILGSFEQVDINRHKLKFISHLSEVLFELGQLDGPSNPDLDRSRQKSRKERKDKNSMEIESRRSSYKSTQSSPSKNILSELLNEWAHLQQSLRKDTSHHSEVFRNSKRQLDGFLDQCNLIASQSNHLSQQVEQLRLEVQTIIQLSSQPAAGCFEWVDGMLLEALQKGHWIVFDNVNFCPPTVLDRLNSLFEPNGYLVVNERGLTQDGKLKIVRAHPNFRVFFVLDPKNGEISRAMRNRGLEVSLLDPIINSLDTLRLLGQFGIPAPLGQLMINHHLQLEHQFLGQHSFSFRQLLDWAELLKVQLEHQTPFLKAVHICILQVYNEIPKKSLSSALSPFKEFGDNMGTICYSRPLISPYLDTQRFLVDFSRAFLLERSALARHLIHQNKKLRQSTKNVELDFRIILSILYLIKTATFGEYRAKFYPQKQLISQLLEDYPQPRKNLDTTFESLSNSLPFAQSSFEIVTLKVQHAEDIHIDLALNMNLFRKVVPIVDQQPYLEFSSKLRAQMHLIYFFQERNPSQLLDSPLKPKIAILMPEIYSVLSSFLQDPSAGAVKIPLFFTVLNILESIWSLFVGATKDNLGKFVILWKLLDRNLKQLGIQKGVSICIRTSPAISTWMKENKFTLLPFSKLWKSHHPPAWRTETIFKLYQELVSLERDEFQISSMKWLVNEHHALNLISPETKQILGEGIATVRCSNTLVNAEQLIEDLTTLPTIVQNELKKAKEEASLAQKHSVETFLPSDETEQARRLSNQLLHSESSLIPLNDHQSLILEIQLISELFSCLDEPHFNHLSLSFTAEGMHYINRSVLLPLKQFSEPGYAYSTRPPSDFAVFKQLYWVFTQSTELIDGALTLDLISEVSHNFHCRLWNNSFNSLLEEIEMKELSLTASIILPHDPLVFALISKICSLDGLKLFQYETKEKQLNKMIEMISKFKFPRFTPNNDFDLSLRILKQVRTKQFPQIIGLISFFDRRFMGWSKKFNLPTERNLSNWSTRSKLFHHTKSS